MANKTQELIKPIVKFGNSAGVILPREWLNGKAKIELVEKPLNINKDILEILEPYFNDIQGIYLVGSYARGEQTQESDIDVLVEFSEPVGFFKFIKLENFLKKIFKKKVDLATKGALKPLIKQDILKDVIYA